MDVFKALGFLGVNAGDVFGSVLHAATPKIAKAAWQAGLSRASDEACRKIGRLLVLAGQKLQKGDRDGAAGDLARVTGEVKLF